MIVANKDEPTEAELAKWTPNYLLEVLEHAKREPDLNERPRSTGGCCSSTHPHAFTGSQFQHWLVDNGRANGLTQASRLAQLMFDNGLVAHVTRDTHFQPGDNLYTLTASELERGKALPEQEPASWAQLQDLDGQEFSVDELLSALQDRSDLLVKNAGNHIPDMLFDKHNCEMFDRVRPRFWRDPEEPATGKEQELKEEGSFNKIEEVKQGVGSRSDPLRYDMVVIGGGAAGMVTAAAASIYGAKACMIERNLVGGDCLYTGCVPSKAFLKAAHVAHAAKTGAEYGIECGEVKVNFGKVMERMRRIRAEISKSDSASKFQDYYGLNIFFGHAKFTGRDTVEINGKTIQFFRACIATGASANIPQIEGIDKIKYYSSENIFNLTEQPKRLLVVGAGPIGCELGQGFARLGTEVVMLNRQDTLLPKDDPAATGLLNKQMLADGVKIYHKSSPTKIEAINGIASKAARVHIKRGTEDLVEDFDLVLFATGRKPNVTGLGLEAAGVEYSLKGIKVNEYLQTTNSAVYSCGDCVPGPNFTHNSDAQARNVLVNSMFFGSEKTQNLIIPYCTYTDPELATIGQNEQELKKAGVEFDVYTRHFDHNDRALTESQEGLYKLLTKKGSDEILGATLCGGPAGDLIGLISSSMHNKIGLSKMGAAVFPYPTYAEIFRQMADAYKKSTMGPSTKGMLRRLIRFRS